MGTQRKDDFPRFIPHPPAIAAALMDMSEDDRNQRMTMGCVVYGNHKDCDGKTYDASDVPDGTCLCPCHGN